MATASLSKSSFSLHSSPSHFQELPSFTSNITIRPNNLREFFPSQLTIKRVPNTRLFPIIRAQSSPDFVPDAHFYKVEAILRPWRIQQVSSVSTRIFHMHVRKIGSFLLVILNVACANNNNFLNALYFID
nr:uncharacterized protein LOC104093998 [Nicotiana tomentosiformis]